MQQIEDCEARESRLSNWEVNFLDSLKKRLQDGTPPTPLQIEKLDQIWERVTKRA
jgi:hypothetical protein